MAQMLNGLKKIYSGEKAFERHISLFSICGIAGILNGYIVLANQGYFQYSKNLFHDITNYIWNVFHRI